MHIIKLQGVMVCILNYFTKLSLLNHSYLLIVKCKIKI